MDRQLVFDCFQTGSFSTYEFINVFDKEEECLNNDSLHGGEVFKHLLFINSVCVRRDTVFGLGLCLNRRFFQTAIGQATLHIFRNSGRESNFC